MTDAPVAKKPVSRQSSEKRPNGKPKVPMPVNLSPAVGALTVGVSFFVGFMSIFVAIMAFAVAGRQGHPHAGVAMSWSNATAMWVSYATGGVAVANCLIAFARARLRPVVTTLSAIVFIITALLVNVLFIRAW